MITDTCSDCKQTFDANKLSAVSVPPGGLVCSACKATRDAPVEATTLYTQRGDSGYVTWIHAIEARGTGRTRADALRSLADSIDQED